MNGLLTLARDYIERMSNPVYGVAVNEDYAMRFAELLETEGFENSLQNEIRSLRDTDSLTSNGWLWLLGWSRARRIDLQEDLLVDLFEEWGSLSARCVVVDLATYRHGDDASVSDDLGIREFPNGFLSRIMLRATEAAEKEPPIEDQAFHRSTPSTIRAEDVLVVLLQVGTPLTLSAAYKLLQHSWEGQEQVFDFLNVLASRLDRETRSAWAEALRVPFSSE